jgi:transposase
LLFVGAQSALRWVRPGKSDPWIVDLLGRKPRVLVGVALANKMARIAWALMARGGTYRMPATIAAVA